MEKKGDDLCIKIRDNGCGINKQQLLNIKNYRHGHTRSIGIKNIEERIRVLFGENYGIEVQSAVKKGTTVILTIPLLDMEKEMKK